MTDKYILQFGNLAGWPYRLALGLRNRGMRSINALVVEKDYLDLDRQLPYDEGIYNVQDKRYMRILKQLTFFSKVVRECGLVHYHGTTILAIDHHLFEGVLLKAFRIPMLYSFGGTDARIISMARKNNPYFHLMPNEEHDKRIRRRLESLSKNIRYAATDCEMHEYVKPYFDKVYTFRQPINLEEFQCHFPDVQNRNPRVLHVPTNPVVKGTAHIESAVERLKAEGLSFEFKMVRRLTQKQLFKEIAKCDIYVDELRCGSYGVTAVEAMASGKPTITYIREDLINKYPPDNPLINANPDTIYLALKKLLLDADMRNDIGRRSRAYVEKYHVLDVVLTELLQAYRDIGYQN